MRRSRWVFGTLALAATVGLATNHRAAAQEPHETLTMTAERSHAIQETLAAIDADKARFVHDLLMSWTPYVDNDVHDLFGDLYRVALRAPAWQLYGAWLVGDFTTMVRILHGEEGPGRYVNRLQRPEARTTHGQGWEVFDPDAFPSGASDNLVYTPITPCRVVDTRGSGARQGVIPAHGTRSFDLRAQAFSSGQGAVGPCPGLPDLALQAAWAVNLTVTGYGGTGGLKAWGFGGTEPAVSVINYAPGQPALANGLVLPGCYSCADDVTIKAFTAGTHVIIDVMGYFRRADAFQSSVTLFPGATTSVSAGSRVPVSGGACPGGTTLVGGEMTQNGVNVFVGGEWSNSTTRWWNYWMINNDAVARNVTVWSRCLDTPIKAWP